MTTSGARRVDTLEWLRNDPPLEELCEAHPEQWEQVCSDVAALRSRDDEDAVRSYMAACARPAAPTPGHRPSKRELVAAEVRRHMLVEALRRATFTAATGVTDGTVRFGLVSGWLLQQVLFRDGLERKPASLPLFRAVWPLLRQRRFLMPLVQPQGIYCFYSRQLVRGLAALVGDRPVLEIAAGDGTLARFLADAGVRVTATDDRSWSHQVRYGDEVRQQGARQALREHRPKVVICSWPPSGNDFERAVFATDSVELYVVISTRSRLSAGSWDAYGRQTGFDMTVDETLSAQVLPPELDPAVYVFRRRAQPLGG